MTIAQQDDKIRPLWYGRLRAAAYHAADMSQRRNRPPSSSGLGRSPFKATTGVRIPVGALSKTCFRACFFVYNPRPHGGDDIRIPVGVQR